MKPTKRESIRARRKGGTDIALAEKQRQIEDQREAIETTRDDLTGDIDTLEGRVGTGQAFGAEAVKRTHIARDAVGSVELDGKAVSGGHVADNAFSGPAVNRTFADGAIASPKLGPVAANRLPDLSGLNGNLGYSRMNGTHGNEGHDPPFAPKKHNHQKSISFYSMTDAARAVLLAGREALRVARDDTGTMTQEEKVDRLITGVLHVMHATYDSPNSTGEQIHDAIMNGSTTRETFAESQYQDAPDFTQSYHWNNPGIDIEGGSSPGLHPINVKVSNVQYTIADLSPYTIQEVS